MRFWHIVLVVVFTSGAAFAVPGNTVHIVIPHDTNEALEIGYKALTAALRDSGNAVTILQEGALDELPSGAILAGHTNRFLPKSFMPTDLEDDGFLIRPLNDSLVVAGRSNLSDAFGLCYLAERIRIGTEDWRRVNVRREPHFKIRMASGSTMEDALRRGYNTWLATPRVAHVVTFEDYDTEFFSPDALTKRLVTAKAARIQLKRLEELGLKSFGGGDEIQFPAEILDRPYTAELMELNNPNEFCVASEKMWEVYRAKFHEYTSRFPQVDYYMMRLGENYSHLSGGTLVGNGVYRYNGNDPYCDRCKNLSYEERIAKVINETQALFADSPIQYMHRTWDTHQDRMHGDALVYQRILDLVPERNEILWSIKYTKTDFWRYNFPNPNIGVGDVPQVIEFQCQREYEGKGAYPNYVGPHVAAGHRLAAQKGSAGVWHWHHGGGWGGPYLATDLWNDANIYVSAQLAWTPMADPQVLAHEWACMTFGKEAAPAITELMMLSTEAVRKQRYFEAYSTEHFGWLPANNWMRDDKIHGGNRLAPIYSGAKDQVDAMIAEKAEALQLVEKMIELAKTAQAKIAKNKSSIPSSSLSQYFLGDWVPEKAGTYTMSLILEGVEIETEIPLNAKVEISTNPGLLNQSLNFSYQVIPVI